MHLYAGADGQLWMGTSAVRRFQLQADTIKLDQNALPPGVSAQPLVAVGGELYSGRRLPYAQSVLFTRADQENMVGEWRVILGERVLAASAGSDSLVCVGETGSVFRVSGAELESGGFVLNEASRLRVSEETTEPLRALVLGDGRVAAACGLPEPQFWVINTVGQTERRVPLDVPLEADPVALEDGFVLPLPGKLHFVRRTAGPPVKDLLLPIGAEGAAAGAEQRSWKHVIAAAADSVVAVDGGGRLLRVQYRTAPTPHLFEVTQLQLEQPVDQRPVVHDERLFLVDASGRLHVLDAATFDVLGDFDIGAPPGGPLYVAGDRLYLETESGELFCFDLAEEVKPLWSAPLAPQGGDHALAGAPLSSADGVIVTIRDGRVLVLNAETGAVAKQVRLPLPLDSGALAFGPHTVVTTVDGSVYRVDLAAMDEVAAESGER
jgi:hypothetical protein